MNDMGFCAFTESVREVLSEKMGSDYKITTDIFRKNNGVELTGIIIQKRDTGVAPTIYMNEFYKSYREGISLPEIIGEIERVYMANQGEAVPDISGFCSYEKAKGKIAYRLVGVEKNRELLKEIPYRTIENLAIIYYYLIEDAPFNGNAAITIYNTHMHHWGIDEQTLFRQAGKNTPVLLPACIEHIEEALGGLCETERKDDLPAGEVPMFILSNQKRINGASCLLYPYLLENYSNLKGCDFYILPSSVHEVILIPADRGIDPGELLQMVTEVNRTQVAREEYLADSVYYYDRRQKRIRLVS